MRISFSKFNLVTYGEKSDSVYIYVHGLGGRKEDAEEFSKIAEKKGFQVLAFDLPGHGEIRKKFRPRRSKKRQTTLKRFMMPRVRNGKMFIFMPSASGLI